MTLTEAARAIGVARPDEIPKEMLAYYPVPAERESETCSVSMLVRLQEKFGVFGQYVDAVVAAWRKAEENACLKAYLDAAGLFMKDGAYGAVNTIEGPAQDGDPVNDAFYLFVLAPVIEKAHDEYVSRGFNEQEVQREIGNFYKFLDRVSQGDAAHPVLTRNYFSWLCHTAKSLLFHPAGFEFELHKASSVFVLQNKQDGTLLPLAHGVTLHKSGMLLGSAGFCDEDGAIEALAEETDDAFCGYPAKDGLFLTEKATFPKSEWEVLLRDGDDCIGCHIPRGADITPESYGLARACALRLVRERYPDWDPKAFICCSWLLSAELEKILKPDSRILAFGRLFTRFPQKDGLGANAFSCIFPGCSREELDALPEETGLQRGAKAIYHAGGVIHAFFGVIALEQ